MNNPVNVTEGRKTLVLTARTASGSRGSQSNRPLLLAPGPIQMQDRVPEPCPEKEVDCTVYFPPMLFLSMATFSFNRNFLFQLLSEPGLCDLDKGRHLSYFFSGFLALHPGLVSSLVVSVCLNNQGLWRVLCDLLSSRQCQVPAGCLPHSVLLAPTFHLRGPLGTTKVGRAMTSHSSGAMELLESDGDKTNKNLLNLATQLAWAAFVTLLKGPLSTPLRAERPPGNHFEGRRQ